MGKTVEFSNNEQRWFQQELIWILPEKDTLGMAYIGADVQGVYSFWRHARAQKEPSYLERQKASGLKPGDWVKVTRAAVSGEQGWESFWIVRLDKYIGGIFQIAEFRYEWGFRLKGTNYWFPYFILEKVTSRPATEADVGKVVVDQWFYKYKMVATFTLSDGLIRGVLELGPSSHRTDLLSTLAVALESPETMEGQA